jgi:hypothetical protein
MEEVSGTSQQLQMKKVEIKRAKADTKTHRLCDWCDKYYEREYKWCPHCGLS